MFWRSDHFRLLDNPHRIYLCLTTSSLLGQMTVRFAGVLLARNRGSAQCSATKGSFFHECKEYGHKDQDVDGGRNHSSDDGCGNRLHHVRTDAALPQDGQEAGENSRDGHQFWPQTLYGSLNDCCFNVFMLERDTRTEALVE